MKKKSWYKGLTATAITLAMAGAAFTVSAFAEEIADVSDENDLTSVDSIAVPRENGEEIVLEPVLDSENNPTGDYTYETGSLPENSEQAEPTKNDVLVEAQNEEESESFDLKYNPSSDTVTLTGGNGEEFVFTIQEDAEGNQYIDLTGILNDCYNFTYMPGSEQSTGSFTIVNNSQHIYRYKDGSLTFLPYDTSGYDNHLEDTATIDGQQIPVDTVGGTIGRTSNKPIMDLFGVTSTGNVTADMMNNLYDVLAEKGYTNDVSIGEDGSEIVKYTALTKYYLDYYGDKYNTEFLSIDDLPDEAKLQILSGNPRPNKELSNEDEISDYMNNWAVPTSNGGISKILETEEQIAELGWNWFYTKCLGLTLDAAAVEEINKTDFLQKYSLAQYLDKNSEAYKEAESLFGNMVLGTDSNGNSVTFDDLFFYVDAYNTPDAYQGYEFGWYMGMELYQADGDLLITKTDENGNPIEGAGFELWQITTSTNQNGELEEIYEYFYGTPNVDDNGQTYYTGIFMPRDNDSGLSCVMHTDEHGNIYIRFLDEEADYQLQEVETPEGYVVDETVYDIVIKGGYTTQIDLVNYLDVIEPPVDPDPPVDPPYIPDYPDIPDYDPPTEDIDDEEPPLVETPDEEDTEEIVDEETPLTPSIPDEEVDEIIAEIEDEVTPLASVPQTGAEIPAASAALPAGVLTLAIAALVRRIRRKD